jgi:hypothetical protein
MLAEFPTQLLVTEPHVGSSSGDPWEIAFTSERFGFYNGGSIPDVRIDGLYSSIGAGSCSGAAATYRNLINQRLANTGGLSPVRVTGNYSSDETTISVTAVFEKVDAVALSNLQAYLEVLEDHSFYQGTEYNHVVRAGYHQAVTLTNVGDFVEVSHTWTLGTLWNLDNINCVAFLQNSSGNKEIYQAARISRVQDFAIVFDRVVQSVPDGNGTATFHGVVTNVSAVTDQLTFSLNNTWGWPAEFMAQGDAGYHTTPVTKTLAPGGTLDVWVHVTTDTALRIGAGYFVTHSATSERTTQTTLRVFNESPAILVVDNDGARTDETIVLNALTTGGYLYDHWDAGNDHAGAGPAIGALNNYDLALYHEGWANDGLSAADQAAVMAFMDEGRGVILSGQDYLNGMTPGTFSSDYLGLASWVTNQDADQGIGVGGDPIGDGMNFLQTYPQWNLDRADNMTANASGTIFMLSEEADRIAVRADNGSARSVFYAFALNAMPANADPNNVKTLLARSIEWILQSSGASVDDGVLAGLASGVREISPNPFAPLRNGSASTTIRLRIAGAAANRNARLDVVDLNGRLVRNLFEGALPAGPHSRTWDGRDASGTPAGAGIYYIRFSNDQGSNSARVVLMR